MNKKDIQYKFKTRLHLTRRCRRRKLKTETKYIYIYIYIFIFIITTQKKNIVYTRNNVDTNGSGTYCYGSGKR